MNSIFYNIMNHIPVKITKLGIVVVCIFTFTVLLIVTSLMSVPYPELNKLGNWNDENPIIVSGYLRLDGAGNFPNQMRITSMSILASKALLDIAPPNTENICFNDFPAELQVIWKEDWINSSANIQLIKPDAPVCLSKDWFYALGSDTSRHSSITYPQSIDQNFFLDLDPYLFYVYPFEKFLTTFTIKANAEFRDSSGQVLEIKAIPASFSLDNNIQNWRIDLTESDTDYIELTWKRTTIISFFGWVFLFIIFLVPLLIPFINDQSNIISIALTYLLGIWVFRSTLVPDRQLIYGLLDQFFLSGSILVIISTLISFILARSPTATRKFPARKIISKEILVKLTNRRTKRNRNL